MRAVSGFGRVEREGGMHLNAYWMRAAGLVGAVLLLQPAWAEEEAAADAPVVPKPSMMAPLAIQNIVLDLAQASGHVVAVGAKGHVFTSPDGKDWTQRIAPVRTMLNRVRFLADGKTGWAVGHDLTIIHTKDGGETWTLQSYDPAVGRPFYDVYFSDPQTGIAIGSYGMYYTTADGGTTWTEQSLPLSAMGFHLNSMTRLNDGSLLIAGERGLAAHSVDNGANWRVLNTPYIGSFFGAFPVGDKGALLYGLRGTLYVLDDVTAAATADQEMMDGWDLRESLTDPAEVQKLGWRQLANDVVETMYGGMLKNPLTALLVGASGTILEVNLATGAVTRVASPTEEVLSSGLQVGDRTLVVGRRGVFEVGGSK